MKSKTNKIIVSIIVLIVILALIIVGVRALSNPSSNKDRSHNTSASKSIDRKSSQSIKTSSSSISTSQSSSSAVHRVQWQSLDLVHKIAILIQTAFPNQNAKPSSQFDFVSNYWDMTGSIDNGEINRYVPDADSFAGISDILSAKIRIVNNQIQVTRPITAPFSISISQAMQNYYQQNDAISYTNNLSARVVTPARLAELQRK